VPQTHVQHDRRRQRVAITTRGRNRGIAGHEGTQMGTDPNFDEWMDGWIYGWM